MKTCTKTTGTPQLTETQVRAILHCRETESYATLAALTGVSVQAIRHVYETYAKTETK